MKFHGWGHEIMQEQLSAAKSKCGEGFNSSTITIQHNCSELQPELLKQGVPLNPSRRGPLNFRCEDDHFEGGPMNA